MADIRTVDLEANPDGHDEVRLQRGGCIVSIWLPADATDCAEAMKALCEIGFDWPEVIKQERREIRQEESTNGR